MKIELTLQEVVVVHNTVAATLQGQILERKREILSGTERKIRGAVERVRAKRIEDGWSILRREAHRIIRLELTQGETLTLVAYLETVLPLLADDPILADESNIVSVLSANKKLLAALQKLAESGQLSLSK